MKGGTKYAQKSKNFDFSKIKNWVAKCIKTIENNDLKMCWEVFGAFLNILELIWVRQKGLSGLEVCVGSRDIESKN